MMAGAKEFFRKKKKKVFLVDIWRKFISLEPQKSNHVLPSSYP